MNHNAAYIFCNNLEKDRVAAHVLRHCLSLYQPTSGTDLFDGYPIHTWKSPQSGTTVFFAESDEVVSHDYNRYLPELNRNFSGCNFVGIVNWHEGINAPDRILCLHTTGDVPSGCFGAADPVALSALFLALRASAQQVGCEYATLSEATHWSGAAHGGRPEQICGFSVPVMDIEIGSSPSAWTDAAAHAALALALTSFDTHWHPESPSILCIGGIHFEESFCAPLGNEEKERFILSHILPNHWLKLENYTGPEGVRRILAAASSIRSGVGAIVFHDNLRGSLKEAARVAAGELHIPAFNHKVLRDPVRFSNAMGFVSTQ